ncbi:MAG: hypothetical protein ACOX0W_08490 [Sphaerochaetaceae bacterium]|jgi:hypothetical protein
MKQVIIGVAIGLVPMLVLLIIQYVKHSTKVKEHKAEISRLKAMVTDRMDLESEGLSKLRDEVKDLKAENENMRITIHTYSQKPGRKEIARLQVYQQAADKLTINSPGFGAAWQSALKESEEELQKTFTGLQPFIKKIIPLKSATPSIEDKS